jgi:hypothetical protein
VVKAMAPEDKAELEYLQSLPVKYRWGLALLLLLLLLPQDLRFQVPANMMAITWPQRNNWCNGVG